MAKQYFGTDGIRGRANEGLLTAQNVMRIASATGRYISALPGGATKVIIGTDTRQSASMFEAALIAGFTSQGINVSLLGVVPTPAVAMMTRSLGATLGVMVTASHNPFYDNGIKFFGANGRKLSDEAELAIEALIDGDDEPYAGNIGMASRDDESPKIYAQRVQKTLPEGVSLSGLKVVLDCANGAAYQSAPEIFRGLGIKDLTIIANAPDGSNINKQCGSTHTQHLSKTVVSCGADIGIALDGDADRLIVCDETGHMVDGDQLLGLLGAAWQKAGTLRGGGIVATVMSNLGLERYLESIGLKLERTDVGDRYVAERMRVADFNIGGEQSGHLLLTDYAATGDGTMAAIQVLAEVVTQGRPASEVLSVFTALPQKLTNVRYEGESPLGKSAVQAAIAVANIKMAGSGRILVRASGTEPLIRVMAEGDDSALVDTVTAELAVIIGKN
ncbi:MAG: phosphoglucosamine mutase [Robiginitomaculum sp.]